MSTIIRRYLPGGGRRGLWHDPSALQLREHGLQPRRASRVEVIESGPRAGRFSVCFSPLGEQFQFSLLQTFDRYDEAVRAEQEWLLSHWILEDCNSGNNTGVVLP